MALLLLIPQLTGCYRYVPAAPGALPTGTEVSVGVTDRGRVELGATLGPGAVRVNGTLLESTDTLLVLAVASVQYLDPGLPSR